MGVIESVGLVQYFLSIFWDFRGVGVIVSMGEMAVVYGTWKNFPLVVFFSTSGHP